MGESLSICCGLFTIGAGDSVRFDDGFKWQASDATGGEGAGGTCSVHFVAAPRAYCVSIYAL